jgi:hypothetical protein
MIAGMAGAPVAAESFERQIVPAPAVVPLDRGLSLQRRLQLRIPNGAVFDLAGD